MSDRDIGDLIASRVEFCISEWRRKADQMDDGGPVNFVEALTLRHCADMLETGLADARSLGGAV